MRFCVSLRHCAPGRQKSTVLDEKLGYEGIVAWENIAEIIATRLKVRPNDPAVEKELRNYCLVVGEKDDVQCTAPEVVPLPSSPPPAIVPTPEPGYASVHKPPRVQNFMESGSGDLVFDSNGDNTVVIDETKINSLMLTLGKPRESRWTKERDVWDWRHDAYRTTVAHKSSYEGKVSGSTVKGATINVKLEAIFLTMPIKDGATRAQVKETRMVGEYVLGSPMDGKPTAHRFSFETPEIVQYKYKSHNNNYSNSTYNRHSRLKSGGESYCGVVLRLWAGGEIKKVKSHPSNRDWEKAAMKRNFVVP